MNGKRKFQIKTYLKFLAVSPWTEKVSLPNLRTLVWVSIIVSLVFKLKLVLFVSIGIAIAQYLWNEYKSGYHIHWEKNRRYKKYRTDKSYREAVDTKEEPKHLNSSHCWL